MDARRLVWSHKSDQKALVDSLTSGEVSLTSTDTVYGLLAPLTHQGREKLDALKNRHADKPYLIIIYPPDAANRFIDPANLTTGAKQLMERFWPGPLTIIFNGKKTLPKHLTGRDGRIALRCPDHAGLQSVLSQFDGLFSTSANEHGAPTPQRLSDVPARLRRSCTYVVDEYEENEHVGHDQPSSIIDLSDVYCRDAHHALLSEHECDEGGEVRIVRRGTHNFKELEACYGRPFAT